MGGLAESQAGYEAASAMSAAGYTPLAPPAQKPLQCPNVAMECRQVAAELQSMKGRLERETLIMAEERERLLQLETVLSNGDRGGKNSLNLLRIKRMQESDVVQRNNIWELEKTLSDLKREMVDLKNGTTESRALAKLNLLETLFKQVPHGSHCKVDSGALCTCHLKAIKNVFASDPGKSVPGGISAATIFNV